MYINDQLAIDESLIAERFVRSPGPGGQNVNKVATAVQLRFAVTRCRDLDEDARKRLVSIAGHRVNRHGEIVITANRHRSQRRNRDDARERLARLIRRALIAPTRRKPPRPPSAAAKRRRVDDKRRRGAVKRGRGPVRRDGD